LIYAYHQLPYYEQRYPSVSDRAEVQTESQVVTALACQLGLKVPELELAGLTAYEAYHVLHDSPPAYLPVHDSFSAVSNLTLWQHEINIPRSAAEKLAGRESGDEPGQSAIPPEQPEYSIRLVGEIWHIRFGNEHGEYSAKSN